MPVVWNAETEAKVRRKHSRDTLHCDVHAAPTNIPLLQQLLAGLFKVCDIKVGSQQLKELAEIIGPGKRCASMTTIYAITDFHSLRYRLHSEGRDPPPCQVQEGHSRLQWQQQEGKYR